MHWLVCDEVLEVQCASVQEEVMIVHRLCEFAIHFAIAVLFIECERMTDRCEMSANLMMLA